MTYSIKCYLHVIVAMVFDTHLTDTFFKNDWERNIFHTAVDISLTVFKSFHMHIVIYWFI